MAAVRASRSGSGGCVCGTRLYQQRRPLTNKPMTDKKKIKRLEAEICATIDKIRKELKVIKQLSNDDGAEGSIICEEARNGVRKLMMARKIGK